MSLISKLTTYARSPQGQSTISRLVASRTGGTTRRTGRRAPTSGGGLAGLAGSLLSSQAAKGRGRGRRR
jgi:hypothetical protein